VSLTTGCEKRGTLWWEKIGKVKHGEGKKLGSEKGKRGLLDRLARIGDPHKKIRAREADSRRTCSHGKKADFGGSAEKERRSEKKTGRQGVRIFIRRA